MKHAQLIGADRPFGPEIAARLESAGYRLDADDDLDALIVNAPVMLDQTRFADVTDAQFFAALEHQLYEPVAAAQAALPRLRAGASIVHVSSRAHQGAWGGAHHMAAGAALIGMSRSMALELASRGIRVNCVLPDFVGAPWDTPTARAELADIVIFLAGPESRLISGETMLLDEARSLKMTETARR